MRWNETLRLMLPPVEKVQPHITGPAGDFGAGEAEGRTERSSRPHTGVDVNYIGGQSGINLQHPNVHSPVSGTVVKAGGDKWNTIAIMDDKGVRHQILHTQTQNVTEGQKVFAGDLIGTMGNVGTRDQHAHYQIKNSAGTYLNPKNYDTAVPFLFRHIFD